MSFQAVLFTACLSLTLFSPSAVAAKQAHNYNVAIPDLWVYQTLSGNILASSGDNVYLDLFVLVNGVEKAKVQWDGHCAGQDCNTSDQRHFTGGDRNNKHYFMAGRQVNVDTGPITSTDRVSIRYIVSNAGHADVLGAISAAAIAVGGATCAQTLYGCLAAALGKGSKWGFPNCDGPILADSLNYTGAELLTMTSSPPNPQEKISPQSAFYLKYPNIPIRYSKPADVKIDAPCNASYQYGIYVAVYRKS